MAVTNEVGARPIIAVRALRADCRKFWISLIRRYSLLDISVEKVKNLKCHEEARGDHNEEEINLFHDFHGMT